MMKWFNKYPLSKKKKTHSKNAINYDYLFNIDV